MVTRPGRGKWKPYWEEGWVCNERTGLWVVDVDDPEAFRRRMEELGIEPPRTRAQSTGRKGGGMHLLYDGRDLPEQYWRQGPLGNPVLGRLEGATASSRPLAPVTRGARSTLALPDSGHRDWSSRRWSSPT